MNAEDEEDRKENRRLEFMASQASKTSTRADPDYDWEGRYEALVAYAQHHGHVRVSPGTKWNGKNIGHFVRNHRVWYREGALSATQIAKFEMVPHWVWLPGKPDWMANYAVVKRAIEALGIAALSQSTEFEGMFPGKWAKIQRDRFLKGNLSPSQINLLNATPGWVWNLQLAQKKAAAKKKRGRPQKKPTQTRRARPHPAAAPMSAPSIATVPARQVPMTQTFDFKQMIEDSRERLNGGGAKALAILKEQGIDYEALVADFAEAASSEKLSIKVMPAKTFESIAIANRIIMVGSVLRFDDLSRSTLDYYGLCVTPEHPTDICFFKAYSSPPEDGKTPPVHVQVPLNITPREFFQKLADAVARVQHRHDVAKA